MPGKEIRQRKSEQENPPAEQKQQEMKTLVNDVEQLPAGSGQRLFQPDFRPVDYQVEKSQDRYDGKRLPVPVRKKKQAGEQPDQEYVKQEIESCFSLPVNKLF